MHMLRYQEMLFEKWLILYNYKKKKLNSICN